MTRLILATITFIVLATPVEATAFGVARWAIAARRAERVDATERSSSRRHPRAIAYRRGWLHYDSQEAARE